MTNSKLFQLKNKKNMLLTKHIIIHSPNQVM